MKIYKGISFLIIVILFSFCKKNDPISENKKAIWINNAFESLESNRYPKIKAISWWHENFDTSFLQVNSSTESLSVYKNVVSSSTFITSANISSQKLIESNTGIYHAAFPDFGGTEDIVSKKKSLILKL